MHLVRLGERQSPTDEPSKPLSDGVVEPLDMSGKSRVFASCLMVLVGDDRLMSIPEIGKANTLLKKCRDAPPQMTTRSDTPTADDTSNHSPGLLAERQPQVKRMARCICDAHLYPAFVGLPTNKRPKCPKRSGRVHFVEL